MPARTLVEKLKYYTARVSGACDPDQPYRQHIYLRAPRTLPEIEIFFDRFLQRQCRGRCSISLSAIALFSTMPRKLL